jgi:pimeloyl-ACP methyl ester carboxylesterase
MGLPRSKLKRVSIVVGLGPPDIPMKGADWLHWLAFPLGFRYLGYTPIMRWFFQRGPEGCLDLSDEKRLEMLQGLVAKSEGTANPKDMKVNRDEDILRLHLRSTREAFAQGFDGVTQDGRISCTDFGFRIEDIRPDLPVQLWYGKQDTFVPLWHGEQIAKRLGGRSQLRVEDETHGSIQINFKEEIFQALVRSA